jgi:hypothetical protein
VFFLHNIFCSFIYLYIHIMVVIMCNFKKLGNFHVKAMNVYIEPLINKILTLWACITMYDICKPMGENKF